MWKAHTCLKPARLLRPAHLAPTTSPLTLELHPQSITNSRARCVPLISVRSPIKGKSSPPRGAIRWSTKLTLCQINRPSIHPPTATTMFRSTLLAATAAFAAVASAQNYSTSGNLTINVQQIDSPTRQSWCRAQTNSCPMICGGRAQPNNCDPVSSAPFALSPFLLTLSTGHLDLQLRLHQRQPAQHQRLRPDHPILHLRPVDCQLRR